LIGQKIADSHEWINGDGTTTRATITVELTGSDKRGRMKRFSKKLVAALECSTAEILPDALIPDGSTTQALISVA